MKKTIILVAVIGSVGFLSFSKAFSDNYFDIIKNIEIFSKTYKLLNTHYAEDIDPNALMKTGLDAMMNSLDPYTVYYSESEIEKYRYQREGQEIGLAAELGLVDDKITILNALSSSPAVQSGLRIGDQILSLEGESLKGKSIGEFKRLMETYPGTSVKLTVYRPSEKKEKAFVFERSKVKPAENVPFYKVIEGDIGYVVLTTFTQRAGKNVRNAIVKMQEENPDLSGIILDLRNNGGGLLSEAVTLCNVFIPQGELVVSTRGKVKEKDRIFKTRGPALNTEIPVAVLVNNNSASASEIVSGVIQDYDRGVLIGRQTYGKGLVQNRMDVAYNSKVKITTSKYYIPSDRCIQSVNYRNGEPVDIADSLRSEYTTKNGRIVLDGGGVRPDIKIPKPPENDYVTALEKKNMVHKFVNEYISGMDSIGSVLEYSFNDMAAFETFLNSENFDYELKIQKEVESLLETEDENVSDLINQIHSLSERIKNKNKSAASEQIRKQIEQEIITRFHYEKGKTEKALQDDEFILAATQVLKDEERYNSILSIK